MRKTRMISLVVLAFAALLLTGAGCSRQTQNSTVNTPTSVTTPEQIYTLDDLALHASIGDCWMAINGLVYDVTGAIAGHLGGQAMLAGCGKEASQLFATKDRGESGPPHSSRANADLANYLIGALK
ncbi:TPA: cytochrome B [Candidatus Uhrbacteria bacterium]|nr:cytochrome B [Candidatus Uhrbacteria bacterium]